jgi:hypothetical protein
VSLFTGGVWRGPAPNESSLSAFRLDSVTVV